MSLNLLHMFRISKRVYLSCFNLVKQHILLETKAFKYYFIHYTHIEQTFLLRYVNLNDR